MIGCLTHRRYRKKCEKCQQVARDRRAEAELIRIPWTEGDTATDISHCVAMLRDELVNRRMIYGAICQPDWMEAMLAAAGTRVKAPSRSPH